MPLPRKRLNHRVNRCWIEYPHVTVMRNGASRYPRPRPDNVGIVARVRDTNEMLGRTQKRDNLSGRWQ